MSNGISEFPYFLEDVSDASLGVALGDLGSVVGSVEVEETLVISESDLDLADVQANSTTEKDVGTAEVAVLEPVDLATLGAAGGKLSRGSDSELGGRAREKEELGTLAEIESEIEIHRNIHVMLPDLGTEVDTDNAGALIGHEEGIIETGSDAEITGDRKVVGHTGISTVNTEIHGIDSFQCDLLIGMEESGAHLHLGE